MSSPTFNSTVVAVSHNEIRICPVLSWIEMSRTCFCIPVCLFVTVRVLDTLYNTRKLINSRQIEKFSCKINKSLLKDTISSPNKANRSPEIFHHHICPIYNPIKGPIYKNNPKWQNFVLNKKILEKLVFGQNNSMQI